VDYLSSCRRDLVHLVAGDTVTTTMIRWYFCAPDAEPSTFNTLIRSQVWESDLDWVQPIGPFQSDFDWDDGHNRGYAGECIQGDTSWYTQGVPQPIPPQPATLCCQRGFFGSGGAGCGTPPGPLPDLWCVLTEGGQDVELEDGSGCVELEIGP